MIERFFDKQCTVTRMAPGQDGSGNYQQTESELESFKCHLQQAQPELAQNLGLSLTKTFLLWCRVTDDIKEGDTLTIEGKTYTVRALQKHEVGANKHIEAIVEYGGTV